MRTSWTAAGRRGPGGRVAVAGWASVAAVSFVFVSFVFVSFVFVSFVFVLFVLFVFVSFVFVFVWFGAFVSVVASGMRGGLMSVSGICGERRRWRRGALRGRTRRWRRCARSFRKWRGRW